MQVQVQNNEIPSNCLKERRTETNVINVIFQKNFLYGVRNACNILNDLEKSIQKCYSYEDKLLRCRFSHKHSHCHDLFWDRFQKDFRNDESIKGNEITEQHQNLTLLESWSVMSIVCLQYQYEELSKNYDSLLKAFNEKCDAIASKDQTITRLRHKTRVLLAQLTATHRSLLCIGEKYLALRNKKNEQIQRYARKIEYLKSRVREVLSTAERERVHLEHKLSRSLLSEPDFDNAMLMAEMKKCNQLYLENLKLKALLEECIPSAVNWNK